MLRKPRNVREFQAWLYERLSVLFPTFHKQITTLTELIDKVYSLDLDRAIDIVAPLYSHTGRPSKDPLAMLRALLCGVSLGIQSITKLVSLLKSSPVLATISGFDPEDTPGVGTFYDFMYRLWGEDKKRFAMRKNQRKSLKNRETKSFVDGPISKADEPISETLAYAVMDNSFPLDPNSSILNQIFYRCIVAKSEMMGLLKSPQDNKTLLSGDGTLIDSGASQHGIKDCDCKSKGISHCDCPRRFSDPDARFGWDFHNDTYVFGYNLYTIIAVTDSGPLPVSFTLQGAHTNDCLMCLLAMNSYLLPHNLCPKPRLPAHLNIQGFK
ncbi:MAG TPA: transposase [Firmicutes bacterium]|nr:transposase [Bacillota bacterium]